jgi:hypothetical protein
MFVAALRKLIGRIWPATTESGAIALQASSEPKRVTAEQADVALGYSPTAMVAYDENLLEHARTRWQIADWSSLSNLNDETLVHHPERGRLALLVGAAKLQLGDRTGARDMLGQAVAWGCDRRMMARLLVAGVHNTLARAAALMGLDEHRVQSHFKLAVDGVGDPSRLTLQARIAIETSRLAESIAGLPVASTSMARPITIDGRVALQEAAVPVPLGRKPILASGRPAVLVRQLAVHDLGLGWASNTVNTVIFRHHGVVTDDDFQFTAFYVDEKILRIVRRTLSSDEVEFHDIAGSYNLNDAHNSISLGVDCDGYLHMSYDHHETQLRHRRSLQPRCIREWSEELPMAGVGERRVTYPSFIQRSPAGPRSPLILLYRDGSSNKGTARLNVYDEQSATWAVLQDAMLSGADQKPWTSNPYWNHPVRGSDGSLHLSFVWRTDSLGEETRINNINIGYAKSLDAGLTWLTSRDRPYRLPITQVNAEIVHPVSPGSNLINQCSMALDSANQPHIVFYADEADGIPQYQHVWFDGAQWRHRVISTRSQGFSLQGVGTLQIPISRPEILIDRKDQVFVVLRGDLTHDRMAVLKLCPPDYQFDATASAILWDEDLGYAEPIVDRIRWQREQVLTMLIQRNHQPHGDRPGERYFSSVSLVDYQLE